MKDVQLADYRSNQFDTFLFRLAGGEAVEYSLLSLGKSASDRTEEG